MPASTHEWHHRRAKDESSRCLRGEMPNCWIARRKVPPVNSSGQWWRQSGDAARAYTPRIVWESRISFWTPELPNNLGPASAMSLHRHVGELLRRPRISRVAFPFLVQATVWCRRTIAVKSRSPCLSKGRNPIGEGIRSPCIRARSIPAKKHSVQYFNYAKLVRRDKGHGQ